MIDEIGAATVPATRRITRALPAFLRDAVGLASVGSIAYGSWLLHPAAGFIVGGTLILAGVILSARRPARSE